MSEQKKHFKLGLFVLVALLIGLGLLLTLGAGKWFATNVKLETYFDESVQGIDIGSKIRYRGVVVGEVSDIGFTYARYEQDKPPTQRYQYVMVTAKVQTALFGGKSIAFPDQATLDHEAKRGLRIKLTPQGLTGTSYLEIDFTDPAENPPLPINWQPDNLYIPTARSTVKQFLDGAQDAMTRLQRINLEGTINNLNRLLETTEKKIDALPVERIGKNLDQFSNELAQAHVGRVASEAASLLAEARESNQQLKKLLSDPALASAPADLAISARRARELLENPQLTQAISRLNQSLGRVDNLLASRDQGMATLIDNLNDISENLKTLSESAQRHPAGLLFGAPPKPYEPPR
ncbi:MAG: MlaD family protein [Formivibrio sp.]|nr:MlaD family protein [Formivibrio sp.]